MGQPLKFIKGSKSNESTCRLDMRKFSVNKRKIVWRMFNAPIKKSTERRTRRWTLLSWRETLTVFGHQKTTQYSNIRRSDYNTYNNNNNTINNNYVRELHVDSDCRDWWRVELFGLKNALWILVDHFPNVEINFRYELHNNVAPEMIGNRFGTIQY